MDHESHNRDENIEGSSNRSFELVFAVLSGLGSLLRKLLSPVVFGIMFFLVVTPAGLLMRAMGKDPLRLRRDADLTSYWIDRQPPGPAPETLKDQF
jgi:hypothetical protein